MPNSYERSGAPSDRPFRTLPSAAIDVLNPFLMGITEIAAHLQGFVSDELCSLFEGDGPAGRAGRRGEGLGDSLNDRHGTAVLIAERNVKTRGMASCLSLPAFCWSDQPSPNLAMAWSCKRGFSVSFKRRRARRSCAYFWALVQQ